MMRNVLGLLMLISSIGVAFTEKYDYIIVGGGTAGCVVASRLSEDPGVSVLVLEAGPSDRDYPENSIPGFWFNLIGGELDWGYYSEPLTHGGQELKGKRNRMSIAKVLGGSSSHNAFNVVRGNAADFDRWREMGNKEWGYSDVLPFFQKFEDVQNPELQQSGFRGVGGPVPVLQVERNKHLDTFMDAAVELGMNVTDFNSDHQLGFAPAQFNIKKGRRMNMAESYIWPIIGRRNLKITLNALVTKIEIQDNHATGVHYTVNGQSDYAEATEEIIVSAGALNTPKLLMLSGIGPRDHLEEMELPVIKDLPVGNGLMDHPYTYVGYRMNVSTTVMPEDFQSFDNLLSYVLRGKGPHSRPGSLGQGFIKSQSQRNEDTYPFLQLTLNNGLFGISEDAVHGLKVYNNMGDKFVDAMHKTEKGQHGFTLLAIHLHQRSVGQVRLQNTDITSAPIMHLPMLENSTDTADMIDGIRFIQRLVKTKAYQSIGAEYTFPPHPACTHVTFDTDDYWACHIKYKSYSISHYMGTCKMAPDSTGVVNRLLKVKGFDNLRVVDASIFPTSVSGNTMAATIMVAEKASHMIKNGRKYKWFKENNCND